MLRRCLNLMLLAACAWAAGMAIADTDRPTKFTNRDTIGNTRHNLTQRQASGGPAGATMDSFRNDYEEVCVYCHTPHGANRTVTAPLWNRTMKTNTYQTYDLLGTSTLTQPVTQPGVSSLTCLSCHDGTTAVDSIINMPGAGRYNAAQETQETTDFLNSWNNRRGPDANVHGRLANTECVSCHSPAGGFSGLGATDFTVFAIGTDLRNDHPVGIRFPAAGPGTDFKDPQRRDGRMAWFDGNGNARPDSNEIRLYNAGGGDGYEVECASCHDPHGVPSAGPGSQFNATFLRVSNTGSAVCQSCHSK
ncbi:cytochrome c3 family protein [Rubrivivax sp. A210]|uniref:cytochrome c3 family protein n=1 Tax=Rubrivivax sp. A210 TaxID=2772301 RepID=UPI003987AEAD